MKTCAIMCPNTRKQLDFKFNLEAGQIHTNLLNYMLVLAPNHVFNHNLHNVCNL